MSSSNLGGMFLIEHLLNVNIFKQDSFLLKKQSHVVAVVEIVIIPHDL